MSVMYVLVVNMAFNHLYEISGYRGSQKGRESCVYSTGLPGYPACADTVTQLVQILSPSMCRYCLHLLILQGSVGHNLQRIPRVKKVMLWISDATPPICKHIIGIQAASMEDGKNLHRWSLVRQSWAGPKGMDSKQILVTFFACLCFPDTMRSSAFILPHTPLPP